MATLQEYREREHVSFSSLNQFFNCSIQWFFQRIARIQPAYAPVSLALGSAIHRTLEYVHLMRKEGKPASGVVDLFKDLWDRQVQDEKNIRFDDDITQDTCAAQGAGMIECFVKNMDQDEQVLSVNEAFCVPLIDAAGNTLEKPLVGEIDCVVSKGGKTVVVDWKSSAKRWSKTKCHKDLQPSALLYAYEKMHGLVPDFRFDVVVKNKTPVIEHHSTTRTADDFNRFAELVKVMEATVQAELFYPNQSSFFCSNCPYDEACKSWHRNKSKLISVAA